MTLYKGFSTLGKSKNFRVTDFELVKRDLENHFNIRKGEKLMNPEFGTVIWDMIFEPMNEDVKNLILEDVQRIIATDPRIVAENVIVTSYDRGIQIEIQLVYVATDQRDRLVLDFDNQTNSLNLI